MTDHTAALRESVLKAMNRAWLLGQTYWQQADSESYSQNRKSDDTRTKFLALMDEVATLLEGAQPQQPAGWIAVSDKRPDNCETVLAFWTPGSGKVHSGCWATATFENGRWYNPEDDEDDYAEPSFWKPVDSPLDAPAHPSQQEDDLVPDICPRCDGSGEETVSSGSGPDAHDVTIDCTHCKGHGGLLNAYNGVVETLKMERAAHLRAAGERLLKAATSQQEDDVRDAVRWRAFRERDRFENFDYTNFQDQFREDADRIVDTAMTAAQDAAQGGGNG